MKNEECLNKLNKTHKEKYKNSRDRAFKDKTFLVGVMIIVISIIDRLTINIGPTLPQEPIFSVFYMAGHY